MSVFQALTLAFYASLAMLALWSTRRCPDATWVGVCLAAGFAVSNLLWFGGVDAQDRTGIYTFTEAMVALAAYCGWAIRRNRLMIALVMVTVLSISANIVFAAILKPTPRQVFVWELTTNICFAAECLLALSVGVAHGYKSGRFHRWPRLRWPALKPHAARSKGGPR